MAELKKCAIKNAIRSIEKSYDYHSYNGKYDVLVDLDELVDLIVSITTQATTEAEIRAKAIDEFAEKLIATFCYEPPIKQKIELDNIYDGESIREIITEVAKQLKEE